MITDISKIYDRVVKWNAIRYDRVYNHDLSINLLKEELQEYLDAETEVDQLDAMCDVIYVALGVLWKVDVDDETLMSAEEEAYNNVWALVETDILDPIDFAFAVVIRCKHDLDYPVVLAAQMLITLCTAQMSYFGLTTDEAIEAILVVCDSNDSKSIKKVPSHIKANAGDKGPFFVAPEPRLQAILDRARERRGD